MRTRKILGSILALGLVATGCFKHSYDVGSGGDTQSEPSYDSWHSHWLFGIIGEEEVDVSQECPNGNATVKDRVTFVNALVGILVGVIYYPTTVSVYCAEKGKAAQRRSVELSPEAMKRVALNPKTLQWARVHAPTQAEALGAAVARCRQRGACDNPRARRTRTKKRKLSASRAQPHSL